MRLVSMTDINENMRPEETEYALTNAGRLAGTYIATVGTPRPGEGQMLPMQNYPSVQNAFFLFFHSPE